MQAKGIAEAQKHKLLIVWHTRGPGVTISLLMLRFKDHQVGGSGEKAGVEGKDQMIYGPCEGCAMVEFRCCLRQIGSHFLV